MTAATGDRARQLTVTLAEVFCVFGTLVGTGVLGTPVAESSGGALDSDSTLLAPAGPAFSIWSVVYVGLAAYTIWQWLPGRRDDPRLRATGWLAAASMVLNAAWLLVTQQGWVWLSVAVIVALVLTLGVLVQRLVEHPAVGTAEKVVVDATFGLYLGWVCVATCANVAAAFVGDGVDPVPAGGEAAAIGVLTLVAALSVVLALRLGGRWTVAVALAWGLVWIAVGRLAEEPESTATAVAALAAAAVALGAVVAVRGTRGTSADGGSAGRA